MDAENREQACSSLRAILKPVPRTFAFDVYGTLVNPAGMAKALSALTDNADSFAARWRDKQLEYTFRRALMRRYIPFSECTRQALDFVCDERRADISPAARQQLLTLYGELPAFADAAVGCEQLQQQQARMFAFSNGGADAVRKVLSHNRLLDFFADVVSVDEVGIFKPAPEVYAHFLRRAGCAAEDAWLVSSNPFDIIGARAGGWNAAWVNRGVITFDPWPEWRPTVEIASLQELPAAVK